MFLFKILYEGYYDIIYIIERIKDEENIGIASFVNFSYSWVQQ